MAPIQGNQQPNARPANQPPQEALEACEELSPGDACTVQLRNGNNIQGTCQTRPPGTLVCVPSDRNPQAQSPNNQSLNSQFPNQQLPNQAAQDGQANRPRGNGRSGETGTAGVLRLFEEPLVTEVSWLLPLVLLGIPVILTALGWAWPLEGKHISLLLWAGWLLPSMAYFSFTTGLFHRYYLIMLGPPIAALVGMSLWSVIEHWKRNHWLGWAVLTFISGLTVLFEIYTFREAADISSAVILVTMGCWLAGLSLLAARSIRHIQIAGAVLILVALLAVPFSWAALTTFNTNPDVALPTAGADGMSQTTFMTTII
jgi:4-amino-4-deoxy-L-arabinose transferase-like glycosyltransferase